MFKPELWQRHDEYRTIVITYDRRLSRNHPKYFWADYEPERQKLLNLNLDPLVDYISGFYSNGGRAAKTRHRSSAPCSFLSCFLIKPKPVPALLYG